MKTATPDIMKDRIKQLAKSQGKTLGDIQKFWNLKSLPGVDKRIYTKDFPYSKAVNDLAEYLKCTVSDIIKPEVEEDKLKIVESEINEPMELYHKKNNLDEKTLCHVLKSENLLLQQIITRQDKDIEFLKGQLEK